MAKYMIYVSRHNDDDTQSIVLGDNSAWRVRKILDVLLEQDGIVWEDGGLGCEDGTTIRSETGVVVTTRWWPGRLKKCVEHEYTLPELGWSLEDHDPSTYKAAKRFRYGPELPRTLEGGVVPSGSKRERRPSAAPRADAPDGYVHVSDVAEAMGIDAKQARVALRKLFDAKPAYGWWFDPATLDDLKAKIAETLK